MPIEIKHRDTGAVLHTIDADTLCEADLTGADLVGASLTGAYLYKAYLSGADLSGADLTGAKLVGADLVGANLGGATIDTDKLDRLLARATRSDGHEFFLFSLQNGSAKIKAGCRWMTIADYRAHVAEEYDDTDKGRETSRILDYFDACSAAMTEEKQS